MSERLSIYDQCSMESLRRELRIDPNLLKRLRTRFFKKSEGVEVALNALPPSVRSTFQERVDFHPLSHLQRFDSDHDGASKLVFKTAAGFAIESILLRAATGRVALCVSSQVGCAAKCDFCATGRMGVAHDLTGEEILDQLVQANGALQSEGRRVRNLVFMGMGEPFHNEAGLREALDSLLSPEIFNHPASRILLSTVGVPETWLSVAKDYPQINYALSLHSVNPETREQLIPLARKHSLETLRDTILQLNRIQPNKTSIMIEYLMLDGLNDRLDDAKQLVEWLRGLRVHVNLIPYNKIAEAPHLAATSRERIERFGEYLKSHFLPTTIRYSMGRDIEAACGQLVQAENRRVASAASAARA